MTNKKSRPFVKAHGAGNDFILIDCLEQDLQLSAEQKNDLVQQMCERHFGAGADGLLFLEKPKAAGINIHWDFYNRDGSPAEMCGNAARCVGEYYFNKTGQKKLVLQTLAGIVNVEFVAPGKNKVLLGWPKFIEHRDGGTLVDSGVPHLVILRKKFSYDADRLFCQNLRETLMSENVSCNITLVEKDFSASIRSVTYERGVEDFTLACGTGALASAFVTFLEKKISSVQANLPGGQVQVDLMESSSQIALTGPAQIVYTGEWLL